MKNSVLYEKIIRAAGKFNAAQVGLVLREYGRIRAEQRENGQEADAEIWYLCGDGLGKRRLSAPELALAAMKTPSPAYFWIDYNFHEGCAENRTAFYYKDIDSSTLNIHVLPGIMQEYDREKREGVPELRLDGTGRLIMWGLPTGGQYLPFGEEGWYPVKCGNKAVRELDKAEDYQELAMGLREAYSELRAEVKKTLKDCFGDEAVIYGGGMGSAQSYPFIEWINLSLKGEPRSLNMYDIAYIKCIGVFTDYYYLSAVRGRGNLPNRRDTEDRSRAVISYRTLGEGEKNRFDFLTDGEDIRRLLAEA